MKRRKVVQYLTLAGVGALLPGCVSSRNLGKISSIAIDAARGDLSTLADAAHETVSSQFRGDCGMGQARNIFSDLAYNRPRPLEFPVKELQERWSLIKRELSGKRVLRPQDALVISTVLVPALRMLYQAETGKSFLPYNQVRTWIPRGPSSPLARMSRRDFLRSPKIALAASETTLSLPTTQTIYPGQAMTFKQKGYCLDPGLPAPKAGEQFALRPAKEALPNEILPIYKGVLKASRHDKDVERNLQDIVWGLRTASSPDRSRADRLSSKDLSLLNAAYPGAKQDFLNFRSTQKGKTATNSLVDTFTSEIAGLSNSKVNGLSANKLMNILKSAPAKGEIKKNTGYSMLAPGVAANTEGIGTLEFQTTIANTSSVPFEFDATDYMAESARDVQNVAMVPVAPQDAKFSNIPIAKGQLTPGQYETLSEDLIPDVVDFVKKATFEGFYLGDYVSGAQDSLAISAALQGAKIGADVTPGLGNVLSAYEAWHGRDWLTGDKLGTAERVWAVAGTIPGANILRKAVGLTKATKVIDWAGGEVLGKVGNNWDKFTKIRESGTGKAGDAIYEWVDSEAWEMSKEEMMTSPLNTAVTDMINSDMSDAPQEIRTIFKPYQSTI